MPRAFTLVELLVVIAIIVVLISLLAPSLDQAVYQAELASCGANQKLIASGVVTYALGNNRAYPYRSAVHDPNAAYSSAHFKNPDSGGSAQPGLGAGSAFGLIGHDDRPEIEPYIPFDALLDPMTADIDLSYEAVNPESWIALPYTLHFGFKYANGGMTRIGGKMSAYWGATTALVADIEQTGASANDAALAHPDRAGVIATLIRQQNFVVVQGAWEQTTTFWYGQSLRQRGGVDRNVGFQDGSVIRYNLLPVPPVDTVQMLGDHPMRPLPFEKGQNPMDSNSVLDVAIWVPPN